MFLPKGINNTFTSKDISRLTKCNIRYVGLMLNVMKYLDIIEVIGKNGNQFVYKLKEEAEF